MPKSFAEFMSQINYFKELQDQIDRLIQDEKRRKAIQEGLNAILSQFKGVIDVPPEAFQGTELKDNIIQKQATALLSLYPVILQSMQTPEQVAQVLAGASAQAMELQQKMNMMLEGVKVLNQMNELVKKINDNIQAMKNQGGITPEVKSIYEGLMSYTADMINNLRALGSMYLKAGIPEKVGEVYAQAQTMGRELTESVADIRFREWSLEKQMEHQIKMLEDEIKSREKLLDKEYNWKLQLQREKLKAEREILRLSKELKTMEDLINEKTNLDREFETTITEMLGGLKNSDEIKKLIRDPNNIAVYSEHEGVFKIYRAKDYLGDIELIPAHSSRADYKSRMTKEEEKIEPIKVIAVSGKMEDIEKIKNYYNKYFRLAVKRWLMSKWPQLGLQTGGIPQEGGLLMDIESPPE